MLFNILITCSNEETTKSHALKILFLYSAEWIIKNKHNCVCENMCMCVYRRINEKDTAIILIKAQERLIR